MKIGDKKIRPIANPVPFPKALANYTLYMMLMITAMIRSRETNNSKDHCVVAIRSSKTAYTRSNDPKIKGKCEEIVKLALTS